MLDIKLIRNDPELVKENIRKKFQDAKLPLVDEVLELDRKTVPPFRRPVTCVLPEIPFPKGGDAHGTG